VLIIALVLAVIGLAALVTAVVTSNEVIAWVCIGASVIGVLLLIIDALRERSRKAGTGADSDDADEHTAVLPATEPAEDYPDEPTSEYPLTTDDTDTTAYSDETERFDETGRSDETEVLGATAASSESDTTAVAVDDEVPSDEPSDRDESTKRD
jgi:hypothetical protein